MSDETIIHTLFGALAFLMACNFYMMIRNQWVYRNRIRLLHNDREAYDRLPEYDDMLKKFWVWDVRKFIGANDDR